MPSEFQIIGMKEFNSKLKSFPKIIREEADGIAEDCSLLWAQGAKQDAPKDQGFLSKSISNKKVKDGEWEVISPMDYSGHIEWGTKGKRNVPSDLASYAQSIPYSKSGDYYDFLSNILDWVKRKGIGMGTLKETNEVRARFKQKRITKRDRLLDVAEAIALSIIRHGIKPHPYFFPQRPIVEKELQEGMNRLIGKIR